MKTRETTALELALVWGMTPEAIVMRCVRGTLPSRLVNGRRFLPVGLVEDVKARKGKLEFTRNRGSKNFRAKLDERIVELLRENYNGSFTATAKALGLSGAGLHFILNGYRWRHVTPSSAVGYRPWMGMR